MAVTRPQKNQKMLSALVDAFLENSDSSFTIAHSIIIQGIPLNARFEIEYTSGETNIIGLIHIAISNQNIDLLKLLIDNNANIELQDSRLFTPLQQVILEKSEAQIEMAIILLEAGANANKGIILEDHYDYELHPLLYAMKCSNLKLANLLIPYCNDADVLSESLTMALEKNTEESIEIAKKLIPLDIKPNSISDHHSHCRPLHFATFNENEEIVKLLLGKKASVNLRDKKGNSALLIALQKKNWRLLHIFLTSDQEINQKDLNYILISVIAINTEASLALVPLLLKQGAQVNKTLRINNHREVSKSAWHFAAETGNRNLLVTLYKHGANPNTLDSQWQTASQVLAGFKDLELLNIYNSILRQAKIYYGEKENLFWVIKGRHQKNAQFLYKLPDELFCLVLLEVMKSAIDFYQEDVERLQKKSQKEKTLITVAFFHHKHYEIEYQKAHKDQQALKIVLAEATIKRDAFIKIYNALDFLNPIDTIKSSHLLSLDPIKFLESTNPNNNNNVGDNLHVLDPTRTSKAYKLMMIHHNQCNQHNDELVRSIYLHKKQKNKLLSMNWLHKSKNKTNIINAIKYCLDEQPVTSNQLTKK